MFTEGSPPSTLTLGTPQYSNNNGSTWTYTPVSGNNAPAGYDGDVTNWRIPMTGTIPVNGRFTLNYQVIVKYRVDSRGGLMPIPLVPEKSGHPGPPHYY